MPLTVEEKRARAIAWNKANPDKVRGYRQRWYAQHREEEAARARRQNKANPDKVRERVRRYREANPDKVREYQRRWRARRKAALQAEVEAVADQAAQSAPTGRVVAPCGHCGGQIVLRWEDPTCLQCGRSPTAPRVLAPEEQPRDPLAERLREARLAREKAEGPGKAHSGRFRAVRPRVRLAPAATRAS